jgi:hypothetical protein
MLGVPRRGVIILLPVLNERDNIAELLDRIEFTLRRVPPTGGMVDDGRRHGSAGYLQ